YVGGALGVVRVDQDAVAHFFVLAAIARPLNARCAVLRELSGATANCFGLRSAACFLRLIRTPSTFYAARNQCAVASPAPLRTCGKRVCQSSASARRGA